MPWLSEVRRLKIRGMCFVLSPASVQAAAADGEEFPDVDAAAAAVATELSELEKDSMYIHVANPKPFVNGHRLSPGASKPELSPSNSNVTAGPLASLLPTAFSNARVSGVAHGVPSAFFIKRSQACRSLTLTECPPST